MNRALLVIDVQESFRQLPDWELVSEPDIVGQVNRLVSLARAQDDLVIWVLGSRAGSGTVFDPARGYVRLMDGLDRATDEPVLVKSAHNAFTTTNLHQMLTRRGVRELTVCGIKTEQCCETTTRVAADLGFDVTFAIDATATCPIPDLDGGSALGVRDIIERTRYALSGRFATIRTVAELTGTPLR
ncbi:cysteine hydrolase family protein [Micromonospora sp. NBC_01638]|uniref:cysteine hydrolase family protein n=1 Tax=Micromonospora sp. NBC_01638 TaxID=2975982 RepID=UPI003868508A|nr:isochorismatase family protein [Micromonospora sp. NBC_01638]